MRFSDYLTTLDSLSENGGLLHAAGDAPVGSILPLVLELPSSTIHVKAKVVSCERHENARSPEAITNRGPFSVAFAFVDLSSTTRRALHQVIQDTTAAPTVSR